MKTCCRCHVEKPLEAFAKDKSRPDGLQPRCRECQAALTAEWREINRPWLRYQGELYREAHPGHVKAWRDAHLDEVHAREAAWREAHRQEERDRGKRYRETHQQQATERMQAWRTTNRDAAREAIRRYRTRKADAYVEPIDMEALYARDGGLCQICLRPVARQKATLDHIIPLSRGGLHEFANAQIAHGKCNSSKGARLMHELETPIVPAIDA